MTKFKIILIILLISAPLILVFITGFYKRAMPQLLKTAPQPSALPSSPDSLPPNVFSGKLVDIEEDGGTISITLRFEGDNEDYTLAEGVSIKGFRKGQKVTITLDLAKDMVTEIKSAGP